MAHDPFRDAIFTRLAGALDTDVFEACVVDLLRPTYPTLVLVPGGRDSGRDGVLDSDRESADFLVCTTQHDAAANLRKSIRSHKAHLKTGTRVLFATNRDLSGDARDKLAEVAAAEGYRLVQAYDRHNLVPLLYHQPGWSKRLLDLTGIPQALSKLPRTDRPLGAGPVIGREKEQAWLRDSHNDCVLAGQPGAGKTFLLHNLASTESFYFVVVDDAGRIADEVRERAPTALIVDDAHSRLELLRTLVHFRKEASCAFRIVATCWPAEQDRVTQALGGVAESKELPRLSRDQVVEVIRSTGIVGPPDFLRELVNQADGRPGLAITLCAICLAGNAQGVALGDALARDTMRTVEPLGADAYPLLAAFALGGDRGLELDPTARILGLAPLTALGLVAGMAAGGVLYEVGERTLAVRPRTLRHALVRDVFFKGAGSLRSEELIATAADPGEVATTLAAARARGGKVPIDLIVTLAERAGSRQPLEALAWVGPEEARATLARHPECLIDIARACLEHIPNEVLPLLFDAAIDDKRELHQATDHTLRIIQDWIHSSEPGTSDVVRRRSLLHHASLQWLRSGADQIVGIRALMMALSPKFDSHYPDPGSGRKITVRLGSVAATDAARIATLWPASVACLKTTAGWDWKIVQDAVEKWCYPGRLGRQIPAEVVQALQKTGATMVSDLIPLATDSPGVQQWLQATADNLGLPIEVSIDPAFLIIFPTERKAGYRRDQEEEARTLAREWCTQPAGTVVPRILRFQQEADRAHIGWPRHDRALVWELAHHVADPLAWAKEVLACQGDGNLLWPFLHYASKRPASEWTEIAASCLRDERYKRAAADVCFEASGVPEGLLQEAVDAVSGSGDWADMGILQNRYQDTAIRLLLRHSDRRVAAAAAIGVWHRDPPRSVPETLMQDWRAAIVRGVEESHDLEGVFEASSGLALDWLRARIADRSQALFEPRDSIRRAVDALTKAERAALLQSLAADDYLLTALVGTLVRDDLELYEALLGNAGLKSYHLEPLRGRPDKPWIARALLALDAGYSPAQLLAASQSCGFSWTGNLSDMWKDWAQCYASLEAHEDERIKEVGRLGHAHADRERDAALKEEQTIEERGW